MSMTASLKDELARIEITKSCCKKAEISSILRFGGAIHLGNKGLTLEAELDNAAVARRLRKSISEVFGQESELVVIQPGGIRKGNRYILRITDKADLFARQIGLLDVNGRPVRGLPAAVVGGAACDLAAAWRGAFLAHGSLTEPGRSGALEVTCPGPESALALVGAARRLGLVVKSREVRGVERVALRDGEGIATLLTLMGAQETRIAWEDRRVLREVRGTANRLANFDDANMRRSAQAAVTAAARAARALEILGDDIPEHLASAGKLRVEHGQASLEELGALSEPPLSKDAIAGRIRRLFALADKVAQERGIPDTEQAVSTEMFED
ncbi:MAG: DNA-binding protein WhiA [Actinomycetota bacterium]